MKKYRIFDIGREANYFNDQSESNLNNEKVLRKVAAKSYLPATKLLGELLKRHPEFRASFSFSGVLLEQLAAWAPEVLEEFQKLVATGRVAVLGETYYHSLAFFYSLAEFERQVSLHEKLIKKYFGLKPKVFRNTELAYNDNLGAWAERAGYKGVIAEGWDKVLGWKSPNFLYRPTGAKKIKLLLKNYKLSDDVAFRFSEKSWSEWPLDAGKFSQWINAVNGQGHLVNLFMDYETFGEHQWEDTGIFNFLRQLPVEVLRHPDNDFVTVEEAVERYPAMDSLAVPEVVTWADTERDLSAWTGNELQTSAIAALYDLEPSILGSNRQDLVESWRRLQTSDHFYYMCTKWFADGDVHAYFNPYASPYEAYISYMNALHDLRSRTDALKLSHA